MIPGTETEQIVAKLAEPRETNSSQDTANSVLWKSPILLFTRESLSAPLTTLPSQYQQAQAVKLFKSIQLFISVPIDTSGIDYHVALAQNSFDICFAEPTLRSEFFYQIIKQTSKHSPKHGVQVSATLLRSMLLDRTIQCIMIASKQANETI